MVGAIMNLAGVVVTAFDDLWWVAAVLAVLVVACALQPLRGASQWPT